jgi:hypothetical protein
MIRRRDRRTHEHRKADAREESCREADHESLPRACGGAFESGKSFVDVVHG